MVRGRCGLGAVGAVGYRQVDRGRGLGEWPVDDAVERERGDWFGDDREAEAAGDECDQGEVSPTSWRMRGSIPALWHRRSTTLYITDRRAGGRVDDQVGAAQVQSKFLPNVGDVNAFV